MLTLRPGLCNLWSPPVIIGDLLPKLLAPMLFSLSGASMLLFFLRSSLQTSLNPPVREMPLQAGIITRSSLQAVACRLPKRGLFLSLLMGGERCLSVEGLFLFLPVGQCPRMRRGRGCWSNYSSNS